MPSTDPWVNNLFATKDEKFNANIPKIQKDANGFPLLPTGAFQEDTDVPWRDKRYELSIDKIMGAGSQMAAGLDQVVEGRGRAMEDTIRQALGPASAPTMTQADIDNQFGMGADAAGKAHMERMNDLRSWLGEAGVTGGGLGPALAQQYELARMGQITDAKRSLYVAKAQSDAADRMRNFQNTLVYANAQNRDPSMIGMEWLQNSLELRLGQQAVEKQDRAAREAAKASKKAGTLQGIAGIASGLAGLF